MTSLISSVLSNVTFDFNKLFVGMWQEHLVTEKKEEQPPPMNAFELISMSKGLNLGNLFEIEQVRCLRWGL